jgi:hypothetical protein
VGERRQEAAGLRGGLGNHAAARIDEPFGAWEQTGDSELRGTNSPGERRLERSRRGHLAQIRHDPRNGTALESRTHRCPDQRHGQQEDADGSADEDRQTDRI